MLRIPATVSTNFVSVNLIFALLQKGNQKSQKLIIICKHVRSIHFIYLILLFFSCCWLENCWNYRDLGNLPYFFKNGEVVIDYGHSVQYLLWFFLFTMICNIKLKNVIRFVVVFPTTPSVKSSIVSFLFLYKPLVSWFWIKSQIIILAEM